MYVRYGHVCCISTISTMRTTEHVWHGWTCILWIVLLDMYCMIGANMCDTSGNVCQIWTCMLYKYNINDANNRTCMTRVYKYNIILRTAEHVWHGWTCMSDGAGIAFFHRFSLHPSHTSPLASSSSYFPGKIYFVKVLVLVKWPMFC